MKDLPVLLIGAIGFCLFSYPGFALLQHGTSSSILTAQAIFGLLIACCYAPIPAVMVDSLPINLRYSAISLPFNIVIALTGAITPLVSAFLIAETNDFLTPSYYLMGLSVVMFLAVLTIEEEKEDRLEILPAPEYSSQKMKKMAEHQIE